MKNVPHGIDQRLLEQVRDGATELDALLAASRQLVPSDEGRDALTAGLREHLFTTIRNDAATPVEVAKLRAVMERVGALGRGVAGPREPDHIIEFSAQVDALAALAGDLEAFRKAYDVASLRDMPHFHMCLRFLKDADDHSLERSKLREALGLTQSNLTRVLKVLEKNRLIQRRSAGKHVIVELTKTGRVTEFTWSDRSAVRNQVPVAPSRRAGQLAVREPIAGLNGSYPVERARVGA